MNLKFESERPVIESLNDNHPIQNKKLIEVLSDEVTQHLPPSDRIFQA